MVTVNKEASSGNQELEINILRPSPNPSSGTDVMSDAIMHCNYVCECTTKTSLSNFT